MGRKRKTIKKTYKKGLPSVFLCPECGHRAVNVVYMVNEGINKVICGKCGIKHEYTYNANDEKIDVYCMFIDDYYKQ